MRVYRICRDTVFSDVENNIYSDEGPQVISYTADFATAKKCVKHLADVYVDLVDMKTDKTSLVRLLNGDRGTQFGPPLRTWERTPRGGLKEAPVGDKQ